MKAIEGGVLTQWVKCGNLPEAELSDPRSSYTVTVEVFFDENGVVVVANSDEPDVALSKSVIRAARSTHFVPVNLGGQTVKVHGVLIYKFESGRGFRLFKP